MIYIVVSGEQIEETARLVRANGPRLESRVKLIEYSQLIGAGGLPPGAYVFTSAAGFEPWRRAAAVAVERALDCAGRTFALCNRPSRIPPWYEQLAGLRRKGHPAARTVPPSELRTESHFPLVLRLQSPAVQVESPSLASPDDLEEALSALLLAGCDPTLIYGVHLEGRPIDEMNVQRTSAAVIGRHRFHLPAPGSRGQAGTLLASQEAKAQVDGIADEMAQDLVRIDFLWRDGVPTVWRIDDGPLALLPDPAWIDSAGAPFEAEAWRQAWEQLDTGCESADSSRIKLESEGPEWVFSGLALP